MLNELNRHLLDKPSIESFKCCVCGKPASNNHHVIQKGIGGTKLAKRIPTVPLCGMGNALGCHGLAHSGRLFFDWRDGWWFCLTEEPTTLEDVLEDGTWVPCIQDHWRYG